MTVNWSLTKEQRHYNGERIDFSTNDSWTIGYPHAKKKKDSESNTVINVKCRTVKVLEDNTGEYLGNLGFGFLGSTPKA